MARIRSASGRAYGRSPGSRFAQGINPCGVCQFHDLSKHRDGFPRSHELASPQFGVENVQSAPDFSGRLQRQTPPFSSAHRSPSSSKFQHGQQES